MDQAMLINIIIIAQSRATYVVKDSRIFTCIVGKFMEVYFLNNIRTQL